MKHTMKDVPRMIVECDCGYEMREEFIFSPKTGSYFLYECLSCGQTEWERSIDREKTRDTLR